MANAIMSLIISKVPSKGASVVVSSYVRACFFFLHGLSMQESNRSCMESSCKLVAPAVWTLQTTGLIVR